MLDAFFTPVDERFWAPYKNDKQHVGGRLAIHGKGFPKLKKCKIALIGIGEEASLVRKQLYALQWRFGNLEIADLGNLVLAEDERNRQFALSEAMAELMSMGLTVLVLGGSESYILGQYKAYRDWKEPVEIVQVSPGVDFDITSPLRQILIEKPSNLFNIDFIATQAYYISEETSAMLEKMYFENHRLGEIRDRIEETEPILRSANMLQFNMNAVRHSECPGTQLQSPNGLYAEEAARIARYAGVSNKLNSAFFYGLNLEENDVVSPLLLAQMVWYFVDGWISRYHDHPTVDSTDFVVYRNLLSTTGHEIVFYKSSKSNRWWMLIPHPYEEKNLFIGCSYRDYEMVCADEMPDRWWRAYQRMM